MASHPALLREARELDGFKAKQKEVVLYAAGSQHVKIVPLSSSMGWGYKQTPGMNFQRKSQMTAINWVIKGDSEHFLHF